jgi:hypothetical protein
MSRYSPWLALAALATLAMSCWLPWTWHADLGMHFTGFRTERNIYGKPGKLLLILGTLTAAAAWIPRIWAKRAALLLSALNLAYAVKSYLVFSACYLGYCPEKKAGLFLMVAAVAALLLASLFPHGGPVRTAPPADTPD